MNLVIDNRPIQSVYIDRANNHYAEHEIITKLINTDDCSMINIICKLIFGDKCFKIELYNFLINLYTTCIVNRKNELNKKVILEYISKKDNISIRTLERYITKLTSLGILSVKDNYISFTKYYNPLNIKYPNTDYIVIEVNPNKTSTKIELI